MRFPQFIFSNFFFPFSLYSFIFVLSGSVPCLSSFVRGGVGWEGEGSPFTSDLLNPSPPSPSPSPQPSHLHLRGTSAGGDFFPRRKSPSLEEFPQHEEVCSSQRWSGGEALAMALVVWSGDPLSSPRSRPGIRDGCLTRARRNSRGGSLFTAVRSATLVLFMDTDRPSWAPSRGQ